ncbi:EAL domain-containing protein [Methylobacter sp.]|uniref:EAL domain-containing protein n=1 Tax=Methylobacter sp. TaxID=2051955 RepID=UPI0011FB72D2|nr:EAL domain-containing protein [Methylobacter sp.]TAK62869.1 MAG: EAL domain-containing protein [Methylobacter sp.]
MIKKIQQFTDTDNLRRRAEQQLIQQQSTVPCFEVDAKKLLHELQVHRIELEIQNEELLIAQTEVEESLKRYTELYDMAPVGYLTLGRDGAIHQINLKAARQLGIFRAQLKQQRFSAFIRADSLPVFNDFLSSVFAGKAAQSCELPLLPADRSPTLIVHIEAIANDDDQTCRMILVDITERKDNEEKLKLAHLVYQAIGEAIMVADADNRIVTVNPAFTELTGYTLQEAVGQSTTLLKSGRQNEAFYRLMWSALEITGHWQGEIWNRRKNGEIYLEWLTINTVYDDQNNVRHRVALFSDITDQKHAEQTIWQQANFDSLTGLPNRHMFYERLAQEMKKSQRMGLPLALLFLDLDHFKDVNDTMGHGKGDLLLKEMARRLLNCVRNTDTVARLGGDEFTIILTQLHEQDSIERLAQDILCQLAKPFDLAGDCAYVSVSIGITLYPEDTDDIDTLIKNADQAMYAAKAQGRNCHHYFTISMQEAALTRMRLINDLRNALAECQFWLAYQPIVELTTGNIRKAEALIRWQHPTRGLISPAEFIPVAEATGMIIDIGEWIFREAAQQAVRWCTEHHDDFQISINKSPVQFQKEGNGHLVWFDYMRELGLSGQSIVVEITEGLLMDAGAMITGQLLAFRDAGIQISLDDFGTGYSSLSYLKKFDIDYLKIDQSFTRNLTPKASDLALCEAIIVMAHKLGIKVIAEGIETREQCDLLIAAGCDYGQGYLFSRPVPADEFKNLLVTG